MNSPKVTIGIPTRNRADSLKKAVESALGQDYKLLEVIVSDNFSTDSTLSVLESFKKSLKVLTSDRPLTMGENWNKLLYSAGGEYFLLLSDDDLLECSAVSSLVKALGRDPGGSLMAYGASRVLFLKNGRTENALWRKPPLEEKASDFILESYKGQRYYPTGASLMRVSDMREKGGYLWRDFSLVLDMAMVVKICSAHPGKKVLFVPETVFTSVLHDDNATGRAEIGKWRDEIHALSRLAAEDPCLSPAEKSELLRAADKYGIRFVFSLAISRRGGLTGFFSRFSEAFFSSFKFLTVSSLPFLLFSVCKYFVPSYVLKIKRELNEKKVFSNCF